MYIILYIMTIILVMVEIRMLRRMLGSLVGIALLAAPVAADPPPASGGTTKSLQGGEPRAWIEDPNMHAFYELTKATLGGSPKKVDFRAYHAKSMELFGKFGEARGGSAKGMQDHLKAIPGQMVDIVKADPHVLDSWDNFVTALSGPK